jgi:2-haloacid dehalogenase
MQTAQTLPEACVFDAYGTLFDFASTVQRLNTVPEAVREPLVRVWRDKQLQYTWLRSIEGIHADFWQVTGEALDFAMRAVGIEDRAIRATLMNTWLTLDAFPEVRDVLERLRGMNIRTAILSNGSPEMLRSAVGHARLDSLLNAVLSVEDVGVYKPHPKVYQLAVDRLEVGRQKITFISSNAWDAWGASIFGMQVVWCNRYGQQPENLPGRPDHEVRSLTQLPFLPGS